MEINIQPFSTINPTNGQFLKGHVPHNKGKKWKDYVDGRKKKKMLKGLELGRKQGNPKIAGSNRIKIVGIKNGKVYPFDSSEDAARKTNICARNIRSCCKGDRKKAGGVQWFFDSEVEKWKHLLT